MNDFNPAILAASSSVSSKERPRSERTFYEDSIFDQEVRHT